MPIREMISRLNRVAGTLEGLSCCIQGDADNAILNMVEQLDIVIGSLEEMEAPNDPS